MRRTPLLWLAVCCEEWCTPRTLAERTWSSLMASTWTQATALRQFVLAQPYVNVDHFREHYPPRVVVEVLEGLVHERRLYRKLASELEEHLLHTVTPAGAWRGTKGAV